MPNAAQPFHYCKTCKGIVRQVWAHMRACEGSEIVSGLSDWETQTKIIFTNPLNLLGHRVDAIYVATDGRALLLNTLKKLSERPDYVRKMQPPTSPAFSELLAKHKACYAAGPVDTDHNTVAEFDGLRAGIWNLRHSSDLEVSEPRNSCLIESPERDLSKWTYGTVQWYIPEPVAGEVFLYRDRTLRPGYASVNCQRGLAMIKLPFHGYCFVGL